MESGSDMDKIQEVADADKKQRQEVVYVNPDKEGREAYEKMVGTARKAMKDYNAGRTPTIDVRIEGDASRNSDVSNGQTEEDWKAWRDYNSERYWQLAELGCFGDFVHKHSNVREDGTVDSSGDAAVAAVLELIRGIVGIVQDKHVGDPFFDTVTRLARELTVDDLDAIATDASTDRAIRKAAKEYRDRLNALQPEEIPVPTALFRAENLQRLQNDESRKEFVDELVSNPYQ